MRFKLHIILLIFFYFLGPACTTQETPPTTVPSETYSSSISTKQVKVTRTPIIAVTEDLVGPLPPINIDLDPVRGTKILFWHSWEGEVATVIDNLTSEFNRVNSYDIEVIVESQGSELHEVVNQALITGQFPNLVLATTYDLLTWKHARDIIVDLNEYINIPDLGLSETTIKDFQPLLWEQDISNGIRLGIPSHAGSTLLAYNESWAKEMGFGSAPATPEAFTTQACAAAAASMKDDVIDGNGGFITQMDPSQMMSWIMAFDGDVTKGVRDDYDFHSGEIVEAFEYVKFLFDGGCVWTPGVPYVEDAFSNRKGLFYATTILDLPYIEAAFTENGATDTWNVIPYPTEDGTGLINIIPYSYAILGTVPEEQLAAWLYLKWMIAPENQAGIVKANSSYPARISTMTFLNDYVEDHPQWAEAQDLFQYGFVEPRLSSWYFARWAVRDAIQELLSADFLSTEIPSLLKELNTLLAEIHMEKH